MPSTHRRICLRALKRAAVVLFIPLSTWTTSICARAAEPAHSATAGSVATEPLTSFGCARVTITIDRKTETAMWVDEPVNQSTSQ